MERLSVTARYYQQCAAAEEYGERMFRAFAKARAAGIPVVGDSILCETPEHRRLWRTIAREERLEWPGKLRPAR